MTTIGCRIPHKYFITLGAGQFSANSGADHYETGAYDLALLDAGIENFNIIKYTSAIPSEAQQISIEEAQKYFHHGAVLETIMAQMNGKEGEVITAGVGTMEVYKDDVLIGGFAAEYEGNGSREKAARTLKRDLAGIFARRYGDKEGYEARNINSHIVDLIVDDSWGTVIAALCFVTYLIPEV